MCGIFGYVGRDDGGSDGEASGIVLRGLRTLEYRGYDSWGIAVASGARIEVDKRVGKIGEAVPALPASRLGIGHTRWATHGGVTQGNAHPHLDCGGRLAVIHNGIVSNYGELRDGLARAGHRLRSETDTEVVAHLIEEALAATPDGAERLVAAAMAAFRQLQGMNAIAVLDAERGEVAAVKNGSPLVLGWSEAGQLLASDQTALLDRTRRVTFVEDGQASLTTTAGHRVFDVATGRELSPAVTEVAERAAAGDRGRHPDFMTKEMLEQPDVLRRLAADVDGAGRASRMSGAGHARDRAGRLAAEIAAAHDVFAIGCGSAGYAALAAQYLFAGIAGRRVTAMAASEFSHVLRFVGDGALVLALSQSGETIDVLEPARAAMARGARVVAITNVVGSSLWRQADAAIPLAAGPEQCVLATKSLTAKLGLLLLGAHALAGRPADGAALVAAAAREVERLLADERRAQIARIAAAIDGREHLFAIGRGLGYPLALETALKVKEVSYVHAEGFAGGELKHGVIALIEDGTPCVALAPGDETRDDVLAGAMQVKARGARVIGVSSGPHEAFHDHVRVPDLGPATAIVHAVVAQLLGYDLARRRGHDPDKPRNLAKSVTVK